MSRAFLNEDKFEQAGDELIERPVSSEPNYVTPAGARQLQNVLERLITEKAQLKKRAEDAFSKQRLAEVDRDIRYFEVRLESAILITPAAQQPDVVLFGAHVEVEDEAGNLRRFSIVGEDEADIKADKISWVSPLARALIGHKINDTVTWVRPVGNTLLEITAIHYKESA
jgi:transcription elongation factor GreB